MRVFDSPHRLHLRRESSEGRAPDRYSGGFRFDPEARHHLCALGPLVGRQFSKLFQASSILAVRAISRPRSSLGRTPVLYTGCCEFKSRVGLHFAREAKRRGAASTWQKHKVQFLACAPPLGRGWSPRTEFTIPVSPVAFLLRVLPHHRLPGRAA